MTPETRTGLVYGVLAYGLWGFLPLYFHTLGETPALVVLAHRILWSIPTVLAMMALSGRLNELTEALAKPRTLLALTASAVAIAINWSVYIWAVTHHRVLEGSLGYFINPLVSLMFAAVVFGERFSKLQLAAIGLALLGVLNQAFVVGQFPVIALTLAVSFSIYGVIRKKTEVGSRAGFALEALILAPFALVYLVFLPIPGAPPFGVESPGHLGLLALAGPVTATPLILFALGARRLKVSTIALLQYIAPSLQFFIGIAQGEPFTPAHAVTFGLIWSGAATFAIAAQVDDRRKLKAAAGA
jgi:chloramphenicol-sensitive protein RarD